MVGGLEQGLLDDYDWMRLDVYGLSSRRLFDTISLTTRPLYFYLFRYPLSQSGRCSILALS
jgi:hypothetical protein